MLLLLLPEADDPPNRLPVNSSLRTASLTSLLIVRSRLNKSYGEGEGAAGAGAAGGAAGGVPKREIKSDKLRVTFDPDTSALPTKYSLIATCPINRTASRAKNSIVVLSICFDTVLKMKPVFQ